MITDNPDEKFEGCITVYSIQQALDLCDEHEESFIIGGGSVYRQFLPYATKFYLTLVQKDFEADTFFDPVDFSTWKLIESEEHGPDGENDFSFSYLIYEK